MTGTTTAQGSHHPPSAEPTYHADCHDILLRTIKIGIKEPPAYNEWSKLTPGTESTLEIELKKNRACFYENCTFSVLADLPPSLIKNKIK